MERKKLAELLGSIFVALIFLTSYAAFGNEQVKTNTTTTTVPAQTFYASAHGFANITSYAPYLNINISCSNVSNVSSELNNALMPFYKNGSVSNFYLQQASSMLVQTGNMSSNSIYSLLIKEIDGSAACTSFYSSANLKLPSRMSFYVPTQKSNVIILINASQQGASVPIELTQNMSNSINVSVSALLTATGSIYGNLSVRQI